MSPKPYESGMTSVGTPLSDPSWAKARAEFDETGDAPRLLEVRTALMDTLVLAAHQSCLATAFPEGLAVLAVAGYGRRELFPCSDVDLLILIENPAIAERQRTTLRAFLQHLWDAGARPSHSVRTIADCCELHEDNSELHISLLDQRMLAGDLGLYAKLQIALPRFFHGQRQPLLRQLCRLARSRHAKYHNLIYHLEPNLKETPGGLRDYQLVNWASQLRNTHPDRMPRPEPVTELLPARDFLFAARSFLHLKAGRDSNILTFDLQEEISARPGLFAASAAVWMRDYFRHAREIHRAAVKGVEGFEEQSSSLLVQFRDWRSRVSNAEFFVSRERVYIRAPKQLGYDPELVLRLFEFVARHGLKLATETGRRLAENLAPLKAHLGESRPLWPALERIASLPHAALAFRTMQETGVLTILLPEWERIECLVIRDFYHRYTVDEHTLVTLQTLEELRESAERPAAPASGGTAADVSRKGFRDLLAEIGSPAPLVVALLLHDLGKASRTGAHVPESLLLARGALERLQAPEEVREMVLSLIGQHLDLSSVMTSRDLDDPATARWIADRAGTLEKLKNLTLLTYADISAVNPGAMTPWRLEQLWRVYLIGHNELTRELEDERIHAPGEESPERASFLEGFPVRYVRTHTDAEIAAHIEIERRSRARGVAVDIARHNGTYRLTLVARDRPYLLASIAGALAAFGMNILKAEGFANARGTILDSFVFSDPHRTLELNPTEMDRLRLMLERVTLGKADVKALLQNRPIPAPPSRDAHFAPRVSFDSEASESATLIHISAADRPGLLYDLATALSESGCNIELVLIDTEAHRAIDVFYVTAGGAKLTADSQESLERTLLAAAGTR